MWDDGGGTLPDSFDLADIAAAALKFENDRVNYPTFTNSATHETNDKESEVSPEWAIDDVVPPKPVSSSADNVPRDIASSAKKNMLLEVK